MANLPTMIEICGETFKPSLIAPDSRSIAVRRLDRRIAQSRVDSYRLGFFVFVYV